MIFNGKEIHVLQGAVIVFQHIPLSKVFKRNLDEMEYDCLEELCDRAMTLTESEYKKIRAERLSKVTPENLENNETIKKRLSVSIDISLSAREMMLAEEALSVYITEAEARNDGKSMNVYHNGDMYGLDTEDFRNLL